MPGEPKAASAPSVGSLIAALVKNKQGQGQGLVLNLRTGSLQQKSVPKVPPIDPRAAAKSSSRRPAASNEPSRPSSAPVPPARTMTVETPSSSSSSSSESVEEPITCTPSSSSSSSDHGIASNASRSRDGSEDEAQTKRTNRVQPMSSPTTTGRAFNSLAPTPVAGRQRGGKEDAKVTPRQVPSSSDAATTTRRQSGAERRNEEQALSKADSESDPEGSAKPPQKSKPMLLARRDAEQRREAQEKGVTIKKKRKKREALEPPAEDIRLKPKKSKRTEEAESPGRPSLTSNASQGSDPRLAKSPRKMPNAAPSAPSSMGDNVKDKDRHKKKKKKHKHSEEDETNGKEAPPEDIAEPEKVDAESDVAQKDKKKKKKHRKHRRKDAEGTDAAGEVARPATGASSPPDSAADSFWGRPSTPLAAQASPTVSGPTSAMSIVVGSPVAASTAKSPFDLSKPAPSERKKKRKKEKRSASNSSDSLASAKDDAASKKKKKHKRRRRRSSAPVAKPPDAWTVWPSPPPSSNFPSPWGWPAAPVPAGYSWPQATPPQAQTGSAWGQPVTSPLGVAANLSRDFAQAASSPRPAEDNLEQYSLALASEKDPVSPAVKSPAIDDANKLQVTESLDKPLTSDEEKDADEEADEDASDSSSESAIGDAAEAVADPGADEPIISKEDVLPVASEATAAATEDAEAEDLPAVDPYMTDPYMAGGEEEAVASDAGATSGDNTAVIEPSVDKTVEEAKSLDPSLESWNGQEKASWNFPASLELDPELSRLDPPAGEEVNRVDYKLDRSERALDESEAVEDVQPAESTQDEGEAGTMHMPLWGKVGEWDGVLKPLELDAAVVRDPANIKSVELRRRRQSHTEQRAVPQGVIDLDDHEEAVEPNPQSPTELPEPAAAGAASQDVAVPAQPQRQTIRSVAWQSPMPLDLPQELIRDPSQYIGSERSARASARMAAALPPVPAPAVTGIGSSALAGALQPGVLAIPPATPVAPTSPFAKTPPASTVPLIMSSLAMPLVGVLPPPPSPPPEASSSVAFSLGAASKAASNVQPFFKAPPPIVFKAPPSVPPPVAVKAAPAVAPMPQMQSATSSDQGAASVPSPDQAAVKAMSLLPATEKALPTKARPPTALKKRMSATKSASKASACKSSALAINGKAAAVK